MKHPILMAMLALGLSGALAQDRLEFKSELESVAIDALNMQGQELAQARKRLEDAEAKHRASFEACVAEIASRHGVQPGELRYDGQHRTFYIDAAPVRSADGRRGR